MNSFALLNVLLSDGVFDYKFMRKGLLCLVAVAVSVRQFEYRVNDLVNPRCEKVSS